MIDGVPVERACAEVSAYSEVTMAQEFDRFFRKEPALCDFVAELTSNSGSKIRELALFLSYMVMKAVEISGDGRDGIESVPAAAIDAAYRESESWIDRISQTDGAELESVIADSLLTEAEPFLLQYVIAELNEPMEDGSHLRDEEKGEVFFLLKTVISSLRRAESGASTQEND